MVTAAALKKWFTETGKEVDATFPDGMAILLGDADPWEANLPPKGSGTMPMYEGMVHERLALFLGRPVRHLIHVKGFIEDNEMVFQWRDLTTGEYLRGWQAIADCLNASEPMMRGPALHGLS